MHQASGNHCLYYTRDSFVAFVLDSFVKGGWFFTHRKTIASVFSKWPTLVCMADFFSGSRMNLARKAIKPTRQAPAIKASIPQLWDDVTWLKRNKSGGEGCSEVESNTTLTLFHLERNSNQCKTSHWGPNIHLVPNKVGAEPSQLGQPRTYHAFSRLIGLYCRTDGILSSHSVISYMDTKLKKATMSFAQYMQFHSYDSTCFQLPSCWVSIFKFLPTDW